MERGGCVTPFDPKGLNQLRIYRQGSLVGSLRRSHGGCRFEFAKEAVNLQNFTGLSYTMPKRMEPYDVHGVNLHPFFAGLLPEGLRLKALVKNLKTSMDDMFTILAVAGERCVGDVYAVAENFHRPVQEVPVLSEVNFYSYFEKSLELEGTFNFGDSLAGVQDKLSSSMISFPIHMAKRHKSYILKLNPTGMPNLVQNEFYCLALAKHCGLTTSTAKIVHDSERNPGLLVERFDRLSEDESHGPTLVHQEDACQFLDKYPSEKYRVSLRDIAEGIVKHSTAPPIDLLKLIELYAFSYLIGNGDLHAKNISLQTHPHSGRINLSPAYDLICTYLYKDHRMAIKLNGRDDNIQRAHFIDFGQRFDLKKSAIELILDKLLKRFHKFRSILFEIPMEKKKSRQIDEMMLKRIADLGR